MAEASRHQRLERRLRELLRGAGLPDPDEVAHLRRSVVFVWHESKSLVLVDLDEITDEEDPFEGLGAIELATILGVPSLTHNPRTKRAGQQGLAATA